MVLEGKIALVTGASRGIGRLLALALASKGVCVVGTARSLDHSIGTGGTLKDTIQEIREKGGRAMGLVCEVSDPNQVESTVINVIKEFGRIDLLVNNAGILHYDDTWEFPVGVWQDMMAINVTGPFLFCRFIVPHMIQAGNGNILNITSEVGRRSITKLNPYGTSKAALNQFTINLANELREYKIAVNAIEPGYTATDMTGYRGESIGLVEGPAMWILAQDMSGFTGQVVDRREFGRTWGPTDGNTIDQ
jgi:NAD(P)-dependent dehydrogenase (short-subunit alcohol dehydrogenase family)